LRKWRNGRRASLRS